MIEKTSARDIIEKLTLQPGITKKMAAEILRAIPGIIEQGLQKDGEVRVKGLGTFRLKQVKGKTGRNPRTGERMTIPPHHKVIFLPEQSFKEYINQPNRLLEYQILDMPEKRATEEIISEPVMGSTPPEEYTEPVARDSGYTPTVMPSEREYESLKDGSEPPPPRKKIHWIIPLMAAVIILLSLVFYFRNCYHVEDSSQQSAVSSQQLADSSQHSTDSSQQLTDTTQHSELSTQNSELITQHSELITQNSSLITITKGKHLFQIAREVYGNPYLWVLIYKANRDIISNPEQIIIGKKLQIPSLEGASEKLTRNDSVEVSEGYRLVYQYYEEKGNALAGDYRKAMQRYRSP